MYFYNSVPLGKENAYKIRFKLVEAQCPHKKNLFLVDVPFSILANNHKFDSLKMSLDALLDVFPVFLKNLPTVFEMAIKLRINTKFVT